MHVDEALETARQDLVRKAHAIAADFMSKRQGPRTSANQDWSDLTVQIRTKGAGLTVEWHWRQWYRGGGSGKRHYNSKYLANGVVMRYAKEWERNEVGRTLDKLEKLKAAHRALRKVERDLAKRGLAGDVDDAVIGFVLTSH